MQVKKKTNFDLKFMFVFCHEVSCLNVVFWNDFYCIQTKVKSFFGMQTFAIKRVIFEFMCSIWKCLRLLNSASIASSIP